MGKKVIDSVDLNVIELEAMRDFYVEHVGFRVLKTTSDCIELGVDSTLIRLYQQPEIEKEEQLPIEVTGLYHFAIKVPKREDFAAIFVSLSEKKMLGGASNHGYSEALYFADPLGNGIEIYCDRPMEDWDIRADGSIVGFTDSLDAQSLFELAKTPFNQLPQGTSIGHVHLLVHDLAESEKFYTDLGFQLKHSFGTQAKFLSIGQYHHHIGINTWFGKLPIRHSHQLGVKAIRLNLDNKEAKKLIDPNGIQLMIL